MACYLGDKRINYRILEGWQFLLNAKCGKPYKEFIEDTYSKRLQYKKELNPMQLVLKLVLNSLYGKTAQRRGNKAGNLFNPIICAYITGYTRAQLYSFVRQNNLEQDVVAFATDSIMTRRKIEGLNSKALGEFKYEKSGLVILLSNGIYSFDGEWKQRGIGSDKGIEISHKDTYIDKKGRLLLNLSVKRVTKFRTAWRQNRLGRA